MFTSFIIVIMRSIKLSIFIRKLDRCNQEVILFITGVGTKDKTMNWVVFAFRPNGEKHSTVENWFDIDILGLKYLVTSGSHWAVSEGHSRACVITKSYKNGVFFFQILYSSLMTRSSTASSKGSAKDWFQIHNHHPIIKNAFNRYLHLYLPLLVN